MRKLLFILPLALGACGTTTPQDIANALKDDPNSACIHVENAYPPFMNKFTMVRTGKDGTTVQVNQDCSIVTPPAK